ncbi:RHS repeat-associated core domain-containing protein [Kitasatospora indigofera]|uniref:RHS repeat-associated core domain-containing protein n=1 Tax=Kitasatospora indigofera TaxID=67307 RepID=UPI00167EDBC8|nr:RHS repeat-associated core domain-containing protein [Kitasatospora indigofera]
MRTYWKSGISGIPRHRRPVAAIAVAVVSALGFSLLSPVPALAAGKKPPAPRALQKDAPVKGGPVASKPFDEARLAENRWPGPGAVDWPAAQSVEVDPAAPAPTAKSAGAAPAAGQQAGSSPVRISPARTEAAPAAQPAAGAQSAAAPAKAAATPAKVRVRTLDRPATERAGVRGLLLGLARADGAAAPGAVTAEIDYSGFKNAFGGDWASRLTLVELPACALTTPELAECRTRTPVPTANDLAGAKLTAEVGLAAAPVAATGPEARAAAPVSSGVTLLAAEADASGSGGTYAATSLSPSGSWQVGGSAGDFTYSYPIEVPPSLGGPSPQVGLTYSSGSVDGRTVATNSQASAIGDGWEVGAGGYVERRYRQCADDKGKNLANQLPNNTTDTGDLCYAGPVVAMSLNGRSTELILDDATGQWKPASDDGSTVELKTGAANGAYGGEHWVVTTPEGTRYTFGKGQLPGWSSGKTETKAVFTEPVYGNHPGEPCHAATYAASQCANLGWRWNLDLVEDVHGNAMSYYYEPETNNYAPNMGSAAVSYVRGGQLKRIDYGLRADNLYATAPAQVNFATDERCTANCGAFDSAHAANWPDVPFDQVCSAATCTQHTPSFFNRKRLTAISTQVWNGSSYQEIDTWNLDQEFKGAGDAFSPALWLNAVTRTGKAAGAGIGGAAVKLPRTVFTGKPMANRVWGGTDPLPYLARLRITAVGLDSGGQIDVTYSDPECRREAPAVLPGALDQNTLRCFPVHWTPPQSQVAHDDLFHKYVVTRVDESDRLAEARSKTTRYEYLGGAAWHYDTSEGTDDADRTWSDYRGYGRVRTLHGDAGQGDQVTRTESVYFRGMNGDKLAGGTRSVTVADSQGAAIADEDGLTGTLRESITYSGENGTPTGTVSYEPWRSDATATRNRAGTPGPLKGYRRDTSKVVSRTLVTTSSAGATAWQSTEVGKTFDALGRISTVNDEGDPTRADDDSCTRFWYTDSGGRIKDKVYRTEKVAVDCATTPVYPADSVQDARIYYDDSAGLTAAPTRGLVTRTEEVASYSGQTPQYQTLTRASFDANGRPSTSTDAYGDTTLTSYTTNTNGLTTSITTKVPMDRPATKWLTSTTYLDGLRGDQTGSEDANANRTDLEYDAAGRLAKVWLPAWTKAAHPTQPSSSFGYALPVDATNNVNGPVSSSSSTRMEAGGYRTSYQIFDGLGRIRQTQEPGAKSTSTTVTNRMVADTFYNSLGAVNQTNPPYLVAGAPGGAVEKTPDNKIPTQNGFLFDGQGRPTDEITYSLAVEKWRTTTTYGGNWAATVPPEGGTRTLVVNDATGRPTEMRQYHSQSAVPAIDATATAYDTTRYTYTKRGEQASVVDATGANTWSWTYDLRGRPVETNDPDKGRSTASYDFAGRMLTSTDARGKTLQPQYDVLGRKTAIKDAGTGTTLATWTFDTATKGLGLPASATRVAGGASYTSAVTGYNAAGQPLGSTVTIPSVPGEEQLAGSYSTSMSYTSVGALGSTLLPKAGGLPLENLVLGYSPMGQPTSLSGATSYVRGTTYSDSGEILAHVVGSAANPITQAYYYETGTHRLTDSVVSRTTGTVAEISATSYSYDKAGNITGIKETADTGAVDQQCFRYDYLRRMNAAWTAKTDCATTPTAANAATTVGGPDAYWNTYGFDVTGNRTTETVNDPTGDTTRNINRTLAYPAPGAARPHASTSTTSTGPGGTRLDEYVYDAAGNQITRRVSGSEQSLEWDVEGHLAKVTEGPKVTSYLYDADGSRLIKRAPDGVTLYLGTTELKLTGGGTPSAAVCGTRYYSHGSSPTLVRGCDGKIAIQTADHQGTAQLSVDSATGTVTRRKSMPFGGERGTAPALWPGTKGFVGGTKDDSTGLVHLGAREYDPATGRFVSVDPVLDTSNSQLMNAYAYSNNSPVTSSDPSGLYCDSCNDGQGWPTPNGYEDDGGGGTDDADPPIPAPPADKVEEAKKTKKKTLVDVVVEAGGEILMEVLGINDIRDCFTKGSIGACASMIIGVIPWGKIFKAKKIVKALDKAYDAYRSFEKRLTEANAILKWADDAAAYASRKADDLKAALAKKGAPDAPAASHADGPSPGPSCETNSFTPDTPVLMADGTTKPIDQVEVGDEVATTDPEQGVDGSHTVLATIIGTGSKNLVEITVDTDGLAGDKTDTVTATDHHPFWVAETQTWTDATDLKAGQWLRTSAGTYVQITAVKHWTQQSTVRNLTVADVHTYYVLAGGAPVLVHNCPGTATVHYDPEQGADGHAIIQIDMADGRTATTEAMPQGRPRSPGNYAGLPNVGGEAFLEDMGPRTISRTFELPNAEAAWEAQKGSVDVNFGPYGPGNNCVTYCVSILRAGGVDLPAGARGVATLRLALRRGK